MAPGADLLVWLVDADEVDDDLFAACAAWLGESERARCARFVRPERRRQFIVGRALLRLALGRLLACAPETIPLLERPGQAPSLLACADIGFSISHSGRWVACAAATGVALGIDIERIDRTRDVASMAQHAFDAHDTALVLACSPEQRHAMFYRLWCRHEAVIKLGSSAAVAHAWERDGLAGALACSRPLTSMSVPVQVKLGDL